MGFQPLQSNQRNMFGFPRHTLFQAYTWDNALERVSSTPPMEEGLLADVEGLSIPSLLPQNEDLNHVLNVLCAGGYGAWVVGGAIRDSLLGNHPTEYDICTNATPNEVIESLEEDELDGMQQVVTHWLRLQETNSRAPLNSIYNKLDSLRQGGYIDHCKEWVNCILDKYHPEISSTLLGILRPNIDAQNFLNYQRNNNLCMSLLVIDSKVDDAEHRISVPGQITPNAIYDIIVEHCGRSADDFLPPLSWQDPKQLQVAILTMMEFSVYCTAYDKMMKNMEYI